MKVSTCAESNKFQSFKTVKIMEECFCPVAVYL